MQSRRKVNTSIINSPAAAVAAISRRERHASIHLQQNSNGYRYCPRLLSLSLTGRFVVGSTQPPLLSSLAHFVAQHLFNRMPAPAFFNLSEVNKLTSFFSKHHTNNSRFVLTLHNRQFVLAQSSFTEHAIFVQIAPRSVHVQLQTIHNSKSNHTRFATKNLDPLTCCRNL
jgi:hypothetical protein